MTTTQALGHPLLELYPREPIGWERWMRDWRDAGGRTAFYRGLLRQGFELTLTGDEENIERILFYLSIADGAAEWGMPGRVHTTRELALADDNVRGEPKLLRAERAKISVEAMDQLQRYFFDDSWRQSYREDDYPNWAYWIEHSYVLDALLNFFTNKEGDSTRPGRNIRSFYGYKNDRLRKFLKAFVDFVWRAKIDKAYFGSRRSDAFDQLCIAARPKLVEILVATCRVSILEDTDYQFDEATIAALKRFMSVHSGAVNLAKTDPTTAFQDAITDTELDVSRVLVLRGLRAVGIERVRRMRQAEVDATRAARPDGGLRRDDS